MFFLISNGQDRPSTIEGNKDELYHTRFARYCIGQANNEFQNDFITKVQLNKNFYKGNQWIDQEDVEIFLKDESNLDRNRIQVIHNVIRPLVEQYRGNAIRMNINYRAKSISPQAINRRESKLAETLFYSKIANDPGNPFADDIKAQKPIGESVAETTAMFNNLYTDKYVQKINFLCKFVSERNNFVDKQVRLAEELALSGMAVMKTFEYAGHQEFKLQQSENFFFDRSAKEYDLTDAGFMGDVAYMEPTEIFESWPDIRPEARTAIENYARQYRKIAFESAATSSNQKTSGFGQQNYSGKVPVFTTYWRDGEFLEYGYVKDQYGYDYFTRINFTYDGEGKPRYTDKDLIKSNSARAKTLLGSKLKRRIYVDVLRMAIIIPKEILASGGNSADNPNTSSTDIVLDYGIAPYQETENEEYNSVKFPYKCYCWGYIDGEVLSPVDDAINPQRLVNRILSVAENQISNSRGAGTVIDGTMVENEGDVLRKMNRSEPVLIDAKGRGIQNAIGSYDTTIKQGTMVMFNIIETLKKFTQDSTGINEAIKGESTGSDQLVGVTELMIQRGSLMQEPFYNGITMIYKQCFQSICTVGKRIYADNERNLSIATGDEGVEVLKITKDMKGEDFRSFVKRENSDEMLISAGNAMLNQLFQMQLLDEIRYASLFGRATPDEVGIALREAAREKQEMRRMASKKNQEAEAQLANQANQEQQMIEDANAEAQAREDIKDLSKNKLDLHKENIKALSKIAPNNQKAQEIIMQNAEKFGG